MLLSRLDYKWRLHHCVQSILESKLLLFQCWIMPNPFRYPQWKLNCRISSLNLHVKIPFFLSSTISFTTPFPAASSFVNASQSSNVLNKAHSLLYLCMLLSLNQAFPKKHHNLCDLQSLCLIDWTLPVASEHQNRSSKDGFYSFVERGICKIHS